MMTLALRLGRTLGELGRTLSASELKMWIEYDRRSPIGDIRGDIQAAQVAAAVFNSRGGKVSLQDVVLRWGEQEAAGGSDGAAGLEAFLSNLAG